MKSRGYGGKDRGSTSFRTAFLILVGVLAFILLRDAELGYTFSNEIDGVETSMYDRLTRAFDWIFFAGEESP